MFNYEFLREDCGKCFTKSRRSCGLWLIWIIFGTRWNATASWSCHTATLLLSYSPILLLSLHKIFMLLLFFRCQFEFIYLFVFVNFVWNIIINYSFYCHDLRLGSYLWVLTITIFCVLLSNVIYMGTMLKSLTNFYILVSVCVESAIKCLSYSKCSMNCERQFLNFILLSEKIFLLDFIFGFWSRTFDLCGNDSFKEKLK